MISYTDFISITQGDIWEQEEALSQRIQSVLFVIGGGCGSAYGDLGVNHVNTLRGAFL